MFDGGGGDPVFVLRSEMRQKPTRGALVWTLMFGTMVVATLASGNGAAFDVTRLAIVTGFEIPESARYDPASDRYYVSNVTGHPTAEDDTGFISLMDPDGVVTVRRWIDGRSASVTLNAPKGMAIVGSELWVADITLVRRFDRTSGVPAGAIDLGPLGARFLNDVGAGPDGSVFVSDTGFVFEGGRGSLSGPQRIYRIDAAGRASVVIDDARLAAPNGVFYDAPRARLLIAPLNGKEVFAWTERDGLRIAATGPGGYDGIEALADGRLLVSSQDAASILVIGDGVMTPIITGVADTGDIGVDLKRHRIAIPRLDANVLELWQVR